jgi:hypothetical protein
VTGKLVLPGFVESHIHPDKAFVADRAPGLQAGGPTPQVLLAELKKAFTVDDVYQRARRALRYAVRHGCTAMRAHVEVDAYVGLRGVEALQQVQVGAPREQVLIAARESGKLFPMMTTAAGTIPPAKVLVLGAGVAGLQAIATAKRLGGVVTGFDVRSVVKEQVQSLGGRFLEVEAVKDAEGEGGYARPLTDEENERLRKELGEAAKRQDVIITTAQIPGRPAPRLITADAVKNMAPGSVIIDLAAESGGNVEGSKPGETVERDGVKIIGPANLPSQMAGNASALYAKNLQNLVEPDRRPGQPLSTPRTRSSPEHCSPRKARSSTSEPGRQRHEPDDQNHDLRPGGLRRLEVISKVPTTRTRR